MQRPPQCDVNARLKLEMLVQSRYTPERVRVRCQIVLSALEGQSLSAIAQTQKVTRPTVIASISRFKKGGPNALLEPGQELIGGRIATKGVTRILECMTSPRADGRPWTIRELAKMVQLSPATVQRIWRTRGIDPHLVRAFPLVRDEEFRARTSEIMGAYFHPPHHALLFAEAPATGTGTAVRDHREFFRSLQIHEALRSYEGYYTHAPSNFLHFMNSFPTDRASRMTLVTDIDLGLGLASLEADFPNLTLQILPPPVSWRDLMRWWLLPLVTKGLLEGQMTHFQDLQEALSGFLAADLPDPFIWSAF